MWKSPKNLLTISNSSKTIFFLLVFVAVAFFHSKHDLNIFCCFADELWWIGRESNLRKFIHARQSPPISTLLCVVYLTGFLWFLHLDARRKPNAIAKREEKQKAKMMTKAIKIVSKV